MDKSELRRAVIDCQRLGRYSSELAEMVYLMVREACKRWRCPSMDELASNVQETMLKNFMRLDVDKNIFSWITSVIRNGVFQLKRNTSKRNELLQRFALHRERSLDNDYGE